MAKEPDTNLDEALKKLFSKRNTTPSLDALGLAIVTEFGGAEAFAKEYIKQYKNAKSSSVKTRMMENVIQMVKTLSSDAAPVDYGQFSDDELRALAGRELRKLMETPDAASATPGAETGPAGTGES